MEITRVNPPIPHRSSISKANSNASEKKHQELQTKNAEKKEEYTPSKQSEDRKYVTYGNMNEKDRTKLIEELKKESDRLYENMRNIVEKLILKQGHTFEKFLQGDVDLKTIEVDEQTRIEAAEAISEDGPLGAEATSERIVKFAIAISGGDISKLDKLKEAIDAGFKQVEDIIGELPDVSKRTYDLIMEKLDHWKEEVSSKTEEAQGFKNRGQEIANERRNNQ